jgi:hypothetical protein
MYINKPLKTKFKLSSKPFYKVINEKIFELQIRFKGYSYMTSDAIPYIF